MCGVCSWLEDVANIFACVLSSLSPSLMMETSTKVARIQWPAMQSVMWPYWRIMAPTTKRWWLSYRGEKHSMGSECHAQWWWARRPMWWLSERTSDWAGCYGNNVHVESDKEEINSRWRGEEWWGGDQPHKAFIHVRINTDDTIIGNQAEDSRIGVTFGQYKPCPVPCLRCSLEWVLHIAAATQQLQSAKIHREWTAPSLTQ